VVEGRRCECSVDQEAYVRADLDTLVIAVYCAACSLFPSPAGLRRVRLVSLCGPDWTIIDFDLVAADTPERQAGLALLDRQPLHGQLVLCDKGFAGRNFEQAVHQLGALVLRPNRADHHHRAEPPIASGSSRSSRRSRNGSSGWSRAGTASGDGAVWSLPQIEEMIARDEAGRPLTARQERPWAEELEVDPELRGAVYLARQPPPISRSSLPPACSISISAHSSGWPVSRRA
jgi:hypothetical protein